MALSFLTPWAALVGLVAVLPLAAFLRGGRRVAQVRRALGLPPPPPLRGRLLLAALAAVGALVAAAAAQPVVDRGTVARARPAAEVFVVLDTSRSMLAASSSGAPTRLDRAKRAAVAVREELPGVPVGVASFTDRVLPHLFGTTDATAFRATVGRAIGVNQPPPGDLQPVATTLAALSGLATRNFFAPATRGRYVVLLSDFESVPFSASRLGTVLRENGVEATYVRFGSETERIFGSAGDAGYTPDPRAADHVDALAEATGGRVFGEGELGALAGHVRDAVRSSERVRVVGERGTLELAPWLALAAFLPLAYVLGRRNVSGRLPLPRSRRYTSV